MASDSRHATPSPTARPRGLSVTFDLAEDNDPKEGLPPLKASEQRSYNKLSEEAKSVITSQRPSAFRDTTRGFALKMFSLSNRVNDRKDCEKPYESASSSDPYIPNHLRFKSKLNPSDNLKDNVEAQVIVTDFQQDMKKLQEKLAQHHYDLAKLETRIAKTKRLEGFAEGLYQICHERVQNQLYDKERTYELSRNATDEELSAMAAMNFGYSTGLGVDYFKEYLDSKPSEAAEAIAKYVTNDTDRQRRLYDMTGIVSLRPDNADSEYTPTHNLTRDEHEIVRTVCSAMQKDNWFRTITIDSQKPANRKRAERRENDMITARRNTKHSNEVTELTAQALTGEATPDQATLETLISEVVQKQRREETRDAKKKARKNSLGGRSPSTEPSKKKSKRRGQSQNDGSKSSSQRNQKKRNQKRAKDEKDKSKKASKPDRKRKRGNEKQDRQGQKSSAKQKGSGKKRRKKN